MLIKRLPCICFFIYHKKKKNHFDSIVYSHVCIYLLLNDNKQSVNKYILNIRFVISISFTTPFYLLNIFVFILLNINRNSEEKKSTGMKFAYVVLWYTAELIRKSQKKKKKRKYAIRLCGLPVRAANCDDCGLLELNGVFAGLFESGRTASVCTELRRPVQNTCSHQQRRVAQQIFATCAPIHRTPC